MIISQHLPAIVDTIRNNRTTAIVAGTGSGKSIGVPAAIANTGARCFVVVPTRTAAISLAQYQMILQQKVTPDINKQFVGYAAEGNINYTNETRIAYVTGGHARKKMLSYFAKGKASPMNFCDVLFVDEIHSGTLDTTIIISLWMKAHALRGVVPRLVIASATPVPLSIVPTPVVYNVDTSGFNIDIRYHNRDIDIDDTTLYIEAARIAFDFHRQHVISDGHILLFAPGSNEVEAMEASLKELAKQNIAGKRISIVPAFGALRQEDIELIYRQTAPDERKIVVATNIAETAITINDIGFVVDTMTEKRAETSQSGGFRLSTSYISKDSAKQRSGRTGRTRPGIAYRMITNESFIKLEQHRPPEIQRVPIYEVIMELLAVGLVPDQVILGVDVVRVQQVVQLLVRLGMVQQVNDDIVVTEMGHFAPKFNLSVRNAAFLWQWLQAKHPLFPGVVVAALLDSYGPSYFWLPRRNREQSDIQHRAIVDAHKERYFASYIGRSDLETSLNMWSDMVQTINPFNSNINTVAKWSRDHSMNNKKLRELLQIVERSTKTLVALGYTVNIGPFTTAGVINAARPLLMRPYADRVMISDGRGGFSTVGGPREIYRLDNRDGLNHFVEEPPKGVLALVTAEIQVPRGVLRIISFALDTDFDASGRAIIVQAPNVGGGKGGRAGGRGGRNVAPLPTNNTGTDNINDALDLLASLGLSNTASKFNEPTTVINAFDLLATLPTAPLANVTAVEPITVRSSIASTTQVDNLIRCWNDNKCNITPAQLSTMTAADIVQGLRRIAAQYPFVYRTTSEPTVLAGLQQLVAHNGNWLATPISINSSLNLRTTFVTPGAEGGEQYLSSGSDTSLDWLAEYYTETDRIRCANLFEAWSNYDTRVETAISSLLQFQQPFTLANVNRALNDTIPSCRHGEVIFHSAIWKLLGLQRVLDLSPAWGEHLLAANSAQAEYYYAIASNASIERELRTMATGLSNKYRIGSATDPLPDLPETFDAALFEVPSDIDNNTLTEYVLPTIDVAWSMIRAGGYLIVEAANIDAVARHVLSTKDDVFYCGPVTITNVLTLWVWCKYPMEALPIAQQQELATLMNLARAS